MNALDLVYIAIAGVTAPVWARKRRDGWGERFGRIGHMLTRGAGDKEQGVAASGDGGDRPRILLHAVSVGETAALRTLVPMLAERAEVVVSVTTDTGLARARSLFGEVCDVVRYPLDASWAVRRFLDAVRPDAVGLVELEVWPNFLSACGRRGVPVAVINGRLSERSFANYQRFARVVRPVLFGRLAAVCAQDEVYAQRFGALLDPAKVSVTGSMKWDSVDAQGDPPGPSGRALELARAMGVDPDRPVIVAGSTGPGEEALLHGAVDEAGLEGVQLVCAPRKPERFEEAAAALPGCVRRSTGETRAGERFLLDTIGELGLMYELAHAVVIGRSFFDLYGSDPTEPAAMGKAVVIGPRSSDFASAVGALREADAIEETDRAGLAKTLAALMGDAARRDAMGRRAREAVRGQQGASARHAAALLRLCGVEEPDRRLD